jgi:alpha-tubulin suppressor-like RCC1 family protein
MAPATPLDGGDANEPPDSSARDGRMSGMDGKGPDTDCTDADCDAGGSDACNSSSCACGDSGLACAESEECTGAGCTCVVACDNGLVQRTDGTLWQYSSPEEAPIEVALADASPLVATSFSSSYAYLSCAVKKDGTVWCWTSPAFTDCDAGSSACAETNANGELGNGTTAPSAVPTQVVVANGSPLTNIRYVSVAESSGNACAVGSEGGLWCWGFGWDYSTTTESLYAAPVLTSAGGSPFSDVAQVAEYSDRACARRTDGTVWCWGYIGADAGTVAYPTQVVLPDSALEIAVDEEYEMALTADGHVWVWQDANLAPTEVDAAPDPLGPLSGVIHIQGLDNMACAEKADRSLWCWQYSGIPFTAQELTTRESEGGYGLVSDVFDLCAKATAPSFIDTNGIFYLTFFPVTTPTVCP